MTTDHLKCRFCSFTTKKSYTGKDGKFHGVDKAHQRLIDHVFMEHPEEYDRVHALIGEED